MTANWSKGNFMTNQLSVKRYQRGISQGLAMIVSALIAGIGGPIAFDFYKKTSTGSDPSTSIGNVEIQLHQIPEESLKTSTGLGNEVARDEKKIFGAWDGRTYLPNVAYQAPSDGFVAAHIGGDKPAEGADLLSGKHSTNLANRTRIQGRYGGAVMPVMAGDYWLVSPWKGEKLQSFSIQWMPIQTVNSE